MWHEGFLDESERWDTVQMVGNVYNNKTSKYYFVLPSEEYRQGASIGQITTQDPAYTILNNYRIYDHLTEGALRRHRDNALPPLDIDYTVEIIPRLHKTFTFGAGGHLNETIYHYWDYIQNQSIYPVLRVTESYVLNTSSGPYPAAQNPYYRTKLREWYKTDGTLDTINVKSTTKPYDEINAIRNEAVRRRTNIRNNTSQGIVVALTVLYYAGDQVAAENFVVEILENLSNEMTNYMITGRILPEALDTYTDINHDPILNTIIQDVPLIQADPYASKGINSTVRQYMIDSFKGLI